MTRKKGELGRRMAKQFWPSIKLVSNGNSIDKAGIDAYDGNSAIQIKYDSTIAKTENIYHEIYEKSINHAEQNWRNSPHKCDAYIFSTDGFAILIEQDKLSKLEVNRPLTQISSTSMGFLIPLKEIPQEYIEVKYERKDKEK